MHVDALNLLSNNMSENPNTKQKEEFYSHFIDKGDIVYDVGANIGNRIEPFINLGAKVIAIEPQQDCQKALRANFHGKITSLKIGLGAKKGFKKLYISNANTISSISREWIDAVKKTRFQDYKWEKYKYIRINTLDNLIKKYGKPKFIKIDVEGYELEVLKGLSQSISYISYEYCTPENTIGAIKCLNYLAFLNPNIKCNYSVGESMKLSLDEWISHDMMIKIIKSHKFIDTDFGDIYIHMQ